MLSSQIWHPRRLNLEVYESSSSQIHLDNHPVMKNLRQVTMMIMMKAKTILRPATKMRKIMTVMSRNVAGTRKCHMHSNAHRSHIVA